MARWVWTPKWDARGFAVGRSFMWWRDIGATDTLVRPLYSLAGRSIAKRTNSTKTGCVQTAISYQFAGGWLHMLRRSSLSINMETMRTMVFVVIWWFGLSLWLDSLISHASISYQLHSPKRPTAQTAGCCCLFIVIVI